MIKSHDAYTEIDKELADQSRKDLGRTFARLQRQLLESDRQMLVIVEGWESSGRGYLLNDLTRELDPKWYEVHTFSQTSAAELQEPYLKRFFLKAPQEGHIAFFDRSFYYEVLNQPQLSQQRMDELLHDISFVERALVDDNTLVIKLFVHQNKDRMEENITALESDPYRNLKITDRDRQQFSRYDEFYEHFNEVLVKTDYDLSPWHILHIKKDSDRSRQALAICIQALEDFLQEDLTRPDPQLPALPHRLPLDSVNLDESISDEAYKDLLDDLQERAGQLLYELYAQNKPVVVVYEGTDAAGKGGNIRRLTRMMDPRGYDVATVEKPTEKELAQHYLYRFYRDFPDKGQMTIFDRSWYGRVLVERVDHLTPSYRWKEAYREINQMESNMVDQGTLLLKYLLLIDKDEQYARFEDRAENPDKQYKLTDSDWEAHEQFDEYKEAMNEMVFRTSTEKAPWVLVPSTSKKYARITVLEDFIARVENFLADY